MMARAVKNGESAKRFDAFLKRYDILSAFKQYESAPGLKEFINQLEDVMYVSFIEGGQEALLMHAESTGCMSLPAAQQIVERQRQKGYFGEV